VQPARRASYRGKRTNKPVLYEGSAQHRVADPFARVSSRRRLEK